QNPLQIRLTESRSPEDFGNDLRLASSASATFAQRKASISIFRTMPGKALTMDEKIELEETRRVLIVADKLAEGDVDMLAELADLLRSAGTGVCVSAFLVQLIFQLL